MGAPATFRVSLRSSAESLQSKHYILYNSVVNQNDSAFFSLGLAMATGWIVEVYSSTDNVSFSLFGSELT